MPDEKDAKSQPTEINISIGGDVTGNILLGDKNKIGQPALPRYRVAVGLLLVVILLIIGNAFRPHFVFDNPLPIPSTPAPVLPGMWKVEVFNDINLNGSLLRSFAQSAEANAEAAIGSASRRRRCVNRSARCLQAVTACV